MNKSGYFFGFSSGFSFSGQKYPTKISNFLCSKIGKLKKYPEKKPEKNLKI